MQQRDWLSRLKAEPEYFLAAHAWCLRAARGDDAPLRLAASLALTQFQEARRVAEALGVNFAVVASLHGLAQTHSALGDLPAAVACYEQAIVAGRALQDPRATAAPSWNLARLSIATGQLERARAAARKHRPRRGRRAEGCG